MSRIGKLPIAVPDKVKVDIKGQEITVKGAKGELKMVINSNAKLSMNEGKVQVEPANDTQMARAMWGTARAIINNMVKGVSEGFSDRVSKSWASVSALLSIRVSDAFARLQPRNQICDSAGHRNQGRKAHAYRHLGCRQAARRPGGSRAAPPAPRRPLQGQRRAV